MTITSIIIVFYNNNYCGDLLQCSCQNIEITVGIEYNNEDCGTNYSAPRKLNLTLPSGSTAIDVMEGAANISRSYRFGVTFLGEMGYRIDVINGTQSNETCQWHLYIGVLNETGTLSQLHYILPDNVTNAVLHYTTIQVRSSVHEIDYCES